MDKNLLKIIADNPALFDTLKNVLEEKFSVDSLEINMTNEVLGQMVRARIVGLRALEEGFKEIQRYKSLAERPPLINKAR